MKKIMIGAAVAAMSAGAMADVVLTATGFDMRTAVFGTPSVGTIAYTTAPANNNSTAELAVMTWAGLDLNEDGTFDESIDFTFSLASSAGNILVNGQGLGVKTWATGESLTLSFVEATASIGGTVTFDGFTSAGLGTSCGAAAGDGNEVSASALVNGVALENDWVSSGGYEYKNVATTFAAPADTVTWELSEVVGTGVTPWTRTSDFGMTFAIPEPATFGLFGLAGLGVIAMRRRQS